MKKTTWLVIAIGLLGYTFSNLRTAQAGPLCITLFPGVPLASFVSCVEPGNDDLPAVQAALNLAIEPDIILIGQGSFSPGPESSGDEFKGDDLANNFDITPDLVSLATNTFTFHLLPADTAFISLKQANFFEVFNLLGLITPFTLTHQIDPNDSTSHISTFVAQSTPQVPEPSPIWLLGFGLIGLGWVSSRHR